RRDAKAGLTLAQAEVVAEVYNADLRLARLKAGVTRAGADEAGLWQDPVIGADLRRFVDSAEHPWRLAVTVGFTLPVSGRLEVDKKLAGSETAAALMRVLQQEWSVRMDVRRAWTRLASARAKSAVIHAYMRELEHINALASQTQKAGEMSRADTGY